MQVVVGSTVSGIQGSFTLTSVDYSQATIADDQSSLTLSLPSSGVLTVTISSDTTASISITRSQGGISEQLQYSYTASQLAADALDLGLSGSDIRTLLIPQIMAHRLQYDMAVGRSVELSAFTIVALDVSTGGAGRRLLQSSASSVSTGFAYVPTSASAPSASAMQTALTQDFAAGTGAFGGDLTSQADSSKGLSASASSALVWCGSQVSTRADGSCPQTAGNPDASTTSSNVAGGLIVGGILVGIVSVIVAVSWYRKKHTHSPVLPHKDAATLKSSSSAMSLTGIVVDPRDHSDHSSGSSPQGGAPVRVLSGNWASSSQLLEKESVEQSSPLMTSQRPLPPLMFQPQLEADSSNGTEATSLVAANQQQQPQDEEQEPLEDEEEKDEQKMWSPIVRTRQASPSNASSRAQAAAPDALDAPDAPDALDAMMDLRASSPSGTSSHGMWRQPSSDNDDHLTPTVPKADARVLAPIAQRNKKAGSQLPLLNGPSSPVNVDQSNNSSTVGSPRELPGRKQRLSNSGRAVMASSPKDDNPRVAVLSFPLPPAKTMAHRPSTSGQIHSRGPFPPLPPITAKGKTMPVSRGRARWNKLRTLTNVSRAFKTAKRLGYKPPPKVSLPPDWKPDIKASWRH